LFVVGITVGGGGGGGGSGSGTGEAAMGKLLLLHSNALEDSARLLGALTRREIASGFGISEPALPPPPAAAGGGGGSGGSSSARYAAAEADAQAEAQRRRAAVLCSAPGLSYGCALALLALPSSQPRDEKAKHAAAGGGDGTCFTSLQGLLASTPAELHARLPALLSMERARRICGYFSHTFSGQL
jgi:hypothetical protein